MCRLGIRPSWSGGCVRRRPAAASRAAGEGHPRRRPVRHGTTTLLFAALEVATGKVTDACYPRHPSDALLRFLNLVAWTSPRVKLHVVVDNDATHMHPRVNAWPARNPRIMLHVTPTSGSW